MFVEPSIKLFSTKMFSSLDLDSGVTSPPSGGASPPAGSSAAASFRGFPAIRRRAARKDRLARSARNCRHHARSSVHP